MLVIPTNSVRCDCNELKYSTNNASACVRLSLDEERKWYPTRLRLANAPNLRSAGSPAHALLVLISIDCNTLRTLCWFTGHCG